MDGKPPYGGIERFEMTEEQWQAIADRVNEKEQKEWEDAKGARGVGQKIKAAGAPGQVEHPGFGSAACIGSRGRTTPSARVNTKRTTEPITVTYEYVV